MEDENHHGGLGGYVTLPKIISATPNQPFEKEE